ncbi:uncharacterized protein LOC135439678 [Drosophila montana]|uniref:uncharacterized protein LOC135439678 n=1 Tax=Drosophila montana TaxID=40370 RepID=UPI00313E8EE2
MSNTLYYVDEYNRPPPNYNSWLSPRHAERLKRLGKKKLTFTLRLEKRPMVIALHMFADDLDGLKHWLDMIYEVAALDSFGKQIEFLVDDIWAAYVFDLFNKYPFRRDDSSFSTQSPPLIFGVSAAGEVHFFGSAHGPSTPSLESLHVFCTQLLADSLVQQFRFEDKRRVPDMELANFNDLIYGEQQADILLGFYSSYKLGTAETENFLDNLARLAARMQQEQVNIFKMNIDTNKVPKKFNFETTPALFLLPRYDKHNPIRCYHTSLGIGKMLLHVAEHAGEELNFYDRRAIRRLHADLLKKMKNYFNEESMKLYRYYY